MQRFKEDYGSKTYYGMLRGRIKEAKGRHQAKTERIKHGKWREEKTGASHMETGCWSVPVWLSPAPNYHHLSWPRIKLIPALFPACTHAAGALANCKLG